MVIREKNFVYLQQRKEKDIWQNLFEYPLIETPTKLNNTKLLASTDWKNVFKSNTAVVHTISQERKHILSHQVLHARFIELSIQDKKFRMPDTWEKVNVKKLKNYAVPRLIDKYMQERNENISY